MLKRNKKGFILVAALMVLLVLSVLSTVAITVFSADLSLASDTLDSSQAFFIAESGVNYTFRKLVNDSDYRSSPDPNPLTMNFGQGNFSVDVSKSGCTYTLTSTGTVNNTRRIVEATVQVK